MEAIDIVRSARKNDRFTGSDYVNLLVDDFTELHGDRRFGDDPAVVAGLGYTGGHPVTVVAIEKGKTLESRMKHHFGSPYPEGYRKALRLAREAEKFHRPVINIVDTAGAYAGVEAEERGQGEAIASCLYEMSTLKTPVISILAGEGGSGGALALAVADRLYMLSEAYFSVIAPESCASIIWKSHEHADKAADALRLTAADLKDLGVVDQVFETVKTGENLEKNRRVFMETAGARIKKDIEDLLKLDPAELVKRRSVRYRRSGLDV